MKMVYLIGLFMALTTLSVGASITGQITNNPKTVNQKTRLVFEINSWQGGAKLLAGSSIKIGFPADDFKKYFESFASTTSVLDQSNCYAFQGFNSNEKLTCQVSKTESFIKVTLDYDSVWNQVGFVIGNVLNLDSARKSKPFTISITDSKGQTVDDSAGNINLYIKTDAAKLQSVTLSNSNKTVGGYGTLSVDIIPSHDIITEGKIVMRFPKWDDKSDDPELSYIENETCSVATRADANINSSATCKFTKFSSYDIVTIDQALSPNTIKAGQALKFAIKNIRNSHSLKGENIQQVEMQKLDGSEIEVKTNILFKPEQMAIVPPSYYQPQFAQDQVSTLTEMFLRVRFLNPIPSGSVIRVTFPPEILLSDPSGQQSYINSVKVGITYHNYQLITSTGTIKDTILITDAIRSYRDANTDLTLQFFKVKTPVSSAKTQSFRISIEALEDGKYYPIEGVTAGVTIQTAAQMLPNIDFRTSNQSVFMPLNMTISTRFNGLLKTDDVIQFQYPSVFGFQKEFKDNQSKGSLTVKCSMIIEDKSYQPTCTLDFTQKIIVLKSISLLKLDLTSYTNGALMSIFINDVFLNPTSEKQVQIQMKLHIKDINNSTIAYYDYTKSSSQINYKAKALEVNQFQILPQDQMTGVNGQYLVKFKLEDANQEQSQTYPTTLKFDIELPSQIEFASDGVNVSCLKGPELESQPKCTTQTTNGKNMVRAEIQKPTTLVKEITFTIDKLRNPYSTKTTDSFGMFISDFDGNAIVKQVKGVSVVVSQPSKFGKITIDRESKTNGLFTSFKFQIQIKNAIENYSKLTIAIPDSINVKTLDGTFVECAGYDLIKTSLECKLSNRKIEINLALQSATFVKPESIISFSLHNLQNPLSLRPSETFQFEMKTHDRLYLISKDVQGFQVTNTEVPLIVEAEIIAKNPTLNVASTYQIDFKSKIPMVKGAIIQVIMPKQLKRDPESPQVKVNETSLLKSQLQSTYNATAHLVSIETQLSRDQLVTSQVSLEIHGFINPNEPRFSESFKIKVFDSEKYLSQQILEGLSFTKSCDYPCATCGLSKKTCLSCQLDSTYPLLYNNTCFDKCPPGFFGNQKFKCEVCSKECKTCKNFADSCTSCSRSTDFLHVQSGKCLDKCPDGKYTNQDSGQCEDCNSNCTKCTSIDNCLSCKAGLFFESGKCFEKCPKKMIPSPNGLTCQNCVAPCKECVDTVDHCTSCDQTSKLKYLYGYACLEKCPVMYGPSDKDGFTCVLIQEDVVPFVFLILTGFSIMGIGIAKLFKKNIHFKNTQIAIISSICLGNWIFLLYLTIKDNQFQSTVVLCYGILSSYILNFIFFCLYKEVMRNDEYYMKWRQDRVKRETVLVISAVLTSFQLFRIAFQQLSNTIKLDKEEKEQRKNKPKTEQPKTDEEMEGGIEKEEQKIDRRLSRSNSLVADFFYKFADENSVKNIFNKLTIIMISCVLIPVLIQNIYNLFYTSPGRQLFWEDLESIAITSYLLVLMVYDSYKKWKKIDMQRIKRPEIEFRGYNKREYSSKGSRGSRASFDYGALKNLFKDTNEMKRFQDVLAAAIKDKERKNKIHSSNDKDLQDLDIIDIGSPKGQYNDTIHEVRRHDLDERRESLFQNKSQVQIRKLDLKNTDNTVLTTNTDDNLLASDRHLLTAGDISRRTMLADPSKQNMNVNQSVIDEEYDENIDENINSSAHNNISDSSDEDINRKNIHGNTDQEILNKLELVNNNRMSIDTNANYRDSDILQTRKMILQDQRAIKNNLETRLEGEEIIPEHMKSISTDQFNPYSNDPNSKSDLGEPGHFSIVSGIKNRIGRQESEGQQEGGQAIVNQTGNKNMQIFTSSRTNTFSMASMISSPDFRLNKSPIQEVDVEQEEQSIDRDIKKSSQNKSSQKQETENPSFALKQVIQRQNPNIIEDSQETSKSLQESASEEQEWNYEKLVAMQNKNPDIRVSYVDRNKSSIKHSPEFVSPQKQKERGQISMNKMDDSPLHSIAQTPVLAENQNQERMNTENPNQYVSPMTVEATSIIQRQMVKTVDKGGIRRNSDATEDNLTHILNGVESQHSSLISHEIVMNNTGQFMQQTYNQNLQNASKDQEMQNYASFDKSKSTGVAILEPAQFKIKMMNVEPEKEAKSHKEIFSPDAPGQKQVVPQIGVGITTPQSKIKTKEMYIDQSDENFDESAVKMSQIKMGDFSKQNNRADEIRKSAINKDSGALNRTTTVWKKEDGPIEVSQSSLGKERPVTANQNNKEQSPMLQRGEVKDEGWLDLEEQMRLININQTVDDANQLLEEETQLLKEVEQINKDQSQNDSSLHFYKDEPERKTMSQFGASVYAKSFSPQVRFQKKENNDSTRNSIVKAQMQPILEANEPKAKISVVNLENKKNTNIRISVQNTESKIQSKLNQSSSQLMLKPQARKGTLNYNSNTSKRSQSHPTRTLGSRKPSGPAVKRSVKDPNTSFNSQESSISKRHADCIDQYLNAHVPKKGFDKFKNRKNSRDNYQSNVSRCSRHRNHEDRDNKQKTSRSLNASQILSSKRKQPTVSASAIKNIPQNPRVKSVAPPLEIHKVAKEVDFLDQQINEFDKQSKQKSIMSYKEGVLSKLTENSANNLRVDNSNSRPISKISSSYNQNLYLKSTSKEKHFMQKSANFRAGASIIANSQRAEFEGLSNVGSDISRRFDPAINLNLSNHNSHGQFMKMKTSFQHRNDFKLEHGKPLDFKSKSNGFSNQNN